jgi:hypothetical protein
MARDIPLVTNIKTTCSWSGRYASASTTERAFTNITNMQTYAVKAPWPKIKTSAVTGPPMKFQIA